MQIKEGSVGIVTEVDATNMKARVKWPADDNMVSDWLHILTFKGAYNIPSINEQVACLYDADFNQGVILGSIVLDGEGPYTDEDILGFKLANIEIKISKSSGEITIITDNVVNVKADKITLEAESVEISKDLKVGGKSTFTGDMSTQGKFDAAGIIKSVTDVQTSTVKLNSHLHISAAPSSPTSPPTPGT